MFAKNISTAGMIAAKQDMIRQLRQEILLLEGFKPAAATNTHLGLGPIEANFPNGVFPKGAIHECISTTSEQQAATSGFIAAVTGKLLQTGGTCIWVSAGRTLFPPALLAFGVLPEQVLFFDVKTARDVMWVAEEALKLPGLAVVVAQVREMDLTNSRRLQLAVEKSGVTGFILRHQPKKTENIASVARWLINPLASVVEGSLPGVGNIRWEIHLDKVRNGRSGSWQFQWIDGNFEQVVEKDILIPSISKQKKIS